MLFIKCNNLQAQDVSVLYNKPMIIQCFTNEILRSMNIDSLLNKRNLALMFKSYGIECIFAVMEYLNIIIETYEKKGKINVFYKIHLQIFILKHFKKERSRFT